MHSAAGGELDAEPGQLTSALVAPVVVEEPAEQQEQQNGEEDAENVGGAEARAVVRRHADLRARQLADLHRLSGAW